MYEQVDGNKVGTWDGFITIFSGVGDSARISALGTDGAEGGYFRHDSPGPAQRPEQQDSQAG